MIRGLYTAVSGLITQEAKQDIITNNLANSETVGFKGDNLSVKSFNDVLIQNYDKIVNGKNVKNVIGSLSQGSEVGEVRTDFTQGMIQDTGKYTDFAVDGGGFFTVERNLNGVTQQLYSRDGHFHVSVDGYLVNDSGDRVLAKTLDANGNPTGQPVPLKVGLEKFQSDSNGVLTVGGQQYKFFLNNFNDYNGLTKAGDNLYEGAGAIEDNNISVKQNSLEKSNINVLNEMVNMMTVMRTFESNQKVVQAMDETLGKAVNEVGKV